MKTVMLQMEDEAYEMLMKKIQKIADAEEFCLNSAELHDIGYLFLALVEKAELLTNGEAIQKMLPDAKIEIDIGWVFVDLPCEAYGLFRLNFPLDWWNAKWSE